MSTTTIVKSVNELLEGTTIAPIVVPAKPASKPARKARKTATIDPTVGTGANLAANWNGVMMKSDPATITRGQKRNLLAMAAKLDEEIDHIDALSMVTASNWYAEMKAEVASLKA